MTVDARARADATVALIDEAIADGISWDAMRWRPPDPNFDCPELPGLRPILGFASPELLMHRYGYDGWAATKMADPMWRLTIAMRPVVQAMNQLARTLGEVSNPFAQLAAAIRQAELARSAEAELPPLDPRGRALWLRQHRNTGPDDPWSIDRRRR